MILSKLTVENFRQFFGKGEIHFAPPGDRNVTVILGQNGSGKTTLLNAFLWCFYDRLDVENPEEVVCYKAVQEASIGEEISLSVVVTFKNNDKIYTVTRFAVFQKLDGGTLEEVQKTDFRIDITDSNGETAPARDPKQLIQQILPDGLTGFFFFRGEEMETLAMQSSGHSLSKGVSEFLNFSLLDRAIKDLKKAGKDFEIELDKIAVGDLKGLTEKIAATELDLQDSENRMKSESDNVLALNKTYAEIEKEMADIDEIRPLVEEKNRLVQLKKDLLQKEKEARDRVATVVSRNGFLSAAEEIMQVPILLAEDAIKQGELPAKIKPQFVDDLVKSGICICGREIDDTSKEKLSQWKGADGLAEIEEVISEMRGSISLLANRKSDLNTDLISSRTDWSKTGEEINQVQGDISKIDSELQGTDFGIEHVKELQAKSRKITTDLSEHRAREQQAKDKVEKFQEELEKLRSDRKKLSQDQSEASIIERRSEASHNVIKTLGNLKKRWLTIVQEYLDGQLKLNWKRVAQLDRLVEFTPDFRLTVKEKGPNGEWAISAPSSANLRALALCFVSALIKLAADIRDEDSGIKSGGKRQQLFQGGDYPLVMDAPFATMDKHFKRSVPSGLREVVPQMIIIINHDQWSGEVDEVLRASVGTSYVLRLHTPGGEDEDTAITYAGRSIDYVVSELDAETDWSVIYEVPQ